jgi:hypothetical protein
MKDAAIRRVLVPEILDVLAEKPYRSITAEGRVFTYGRSADNPFKPVAFIGPSAPKTLEQKEILREALEIYRLLSEKPQETVHEPGEDEGQEG